MNTVNGEDTRSPRAPVPRRERVRAATEAEIVRTAHELLVEGGAEALTLREVGRRMGMTASALYRYVEGHLDLVDRLAASCFDDLATAVRSAGAAALRGADHDGPLPDAAFEAAVRAAAQAFRRWSLAHPAEFDLMFRGGTDDAAVAASPRTHEAGERFGRVFLELFARGAGVTPDETSEDVFRALPAPMGVVFARTWARLLGTVMVEAAGQTAHLPIPADELFEAELAGCWELMAGGVRSAGRARPGTGHAPT